MDVHKTKWYVAIYRSDGQIFTFTTSSRTDQFVNQLLSWELKIERVVYEAGPTGFVLARACQKAGVKVGVVAPSRSPRPVTRGAKTDRLDCIKLAEFAAKDLFPRYIAIPTEDQESIRSLERHRFHLVDRIRKVKTRIKGLLLEFAIPEPDGLAHWSGCSLKKLDEMNLKPGVKETLQSHLRELKWLMREMKTVEASLEQLVKESELGQRFRYLKSIPGVGRIVSLAFLAEVFRPERFNRAGEMTSYLGLSPIVVQSGDSKSKASLRQVGQSRLRSLLVEAAWIWKKKDPGAGIVLPSYSQSPPVAWQRPSVPWQGNWPLSCGEYR